MDLKVHNSCSHGNFFRRHLLYHSQVGKFNHRWQKMCHLWHLFCHMCAPVTWVTGHLLLSYIIYRLANLTTLVKHILAAFWDLVILSFLFSVLRETIPDSFNQLLLPQSRPLGNTSSSMEEQEKWDLNQHFSIKQKVWLLLVYDT